jgi:hypothetical protein
MFFEKRRTCIIRQGTRRGTVFVDINRKGRLNHG